jgi:hypothetical protein
MNLIVPCALFMAVGFILAAGCVATTKKNAATPLSNTPDSGVNTTANSTSTLKGSLIVSIAGFSSPLNLSVVLDNKTVGTVNRSTPLKMMVSEGDHTVKVCVDSVCVQENVTARFGRYLDVDFSEQLHREVANAQPTARIVQCNRNGNTLSVEVEFINPSTKDLQMSAVVSCGYSYIDDRTNFKMGDSTRGMLVQNVKAGQSIQKRLDLNFADGKSISYDYPVLELKVT